MAEPTSPESGRASLPEPLQKWNDTRTDYPRDRSVAQLFEETAAAHPNATAVVLGGQALTYAELNRRANRLAHRLRPMGVGPEVMVGCCLERSLGLIVALVAILKAGGAYAAVAGRNSSATVKAPLSTMLRMNRFRLPMRSANELETATPISSEVSPKPLNQLNSLSFPEQYLKKGNITLPRIEIAMK